MRYCDLVEEARVRMVNPQRETAITLVIRYLKKLDAVLDEKIRTGKEFRLYTDELDRFLQKEVEGCEQSSSNDHEQESVGMPWKSKLP